MKTRKKIVTALAFASLLMGGAGITTVHAQGNSELERLRQRIDVLEQQQKEDRQQAIPERDSPERIRSGPSIHSLAGRPQPFDQRGVEIGAIDDTRFNLGFHVVGRGQSFKQSGVRIYDGGTWTTPDSIGPGMQTGWGNIDFQLDIGGDIEVFFDLLIATQRHPTRTWGHQGYFYIRQMPEDSFLAPANRLFEFVDIKAGNFNPNFGNDIHRRSINADVQRNPLIGNPLVSPQGVEPGLEIIHEGEINGRNFGLMVGGGIGAPEQDFNSDRKFSVRGKGWFAPQENLELAYSIYHVDHGDDVDRGTNLFRRERLGSAYSSVWNLHNDDSGSGEGPGQVRLGDGRRLTAQQGDLSWDITDRFFANAHLGYANASGADPSNQTGTEKWLYYGTDLTYYVTDDVYVSGRYSEANARRFLESDNTGYLSRLQAGIGFWIADGFLLKVEYVYQEARGFNDGTRGISGNVDVGANPSFQGGILELSYSF